MLGASTLANLELAAGPSSIPVNTVAPAVTGTTHVGSTLSCTTGTWGAPFFVTPPVIAGAPFFVTPPVIT